MSELLTKLQGEEIFGLLTVAGGLITAIIAILSYNWRVARVAELEVQLKREMIAQGRSGSEIAEVIHSRQGGQLGDSKCLRHQRPEA